MKRAALVRPKVTHMRGKKTALAIIALMLIAGGPLSYYMADCDSVADDTHIQVTEGVGANVK